jgi:hypothetical protein
MKKATQRLVVQVLCTGVMLASLLLTSCSGGGGGGGGTLILPASQRVPGLDPLPASTAASSVHVTGQVPGPIEAGTQVRAVSTAGEVLFPLVGQTFGFDVRLAPNKLNSIYVTTIVPSGEESAVALAQVRQDSTPPSLFIDAPVDGGSTGDSTVPVVGRVADLLSGFMGLDVDVNGISATVYEGLGSNGTYLAADVAIDTSAPGVTTTITATATDAVGNVAVSAVQVTYSPAPAGSPTLVASSEDNQLGLVGTELPDPVTVQARQPNGSPLKNTLVTFQVTRSNGLVSELPGGSGGQQALVFTDSGGFASVFWSLGSDAGCGNNRLVATAAGVWGSPMFCASAAAVAPTQVNIGDGNNQVAEANTQAPAPLRVWVNDGCNGLPNVPVNFNVAQGGGSVEATTVVTGLTGHAQVTYRAGAELGNSIVEARASGVSGVARFVTRVVSRGSATPTSFSGVVLNNAQQPIENVFCELRDQTGATLAQTSTDSNGRVSWDSLTTQGPVHFRVDGNSIVTFVNGVAMPLGTFPALEYEVLLVPNSHNTLGQNVLLPPLDPGNEELYSTTTDTVLTLSGVEGLSMTITAGSMSIDGQPAPDDELVSLNQVHHDDIPMAMPNGASPAFAWTLQPAGATFEPPVTIQYPNTAQLPPGAIAYFLSFDHDTSQFEIVATGEVSNDGSTITSDPGSGIAVAGWGCSCPPYLPTEDCEGSCLNDPQVQFSIDALFDAIVVADDQVSQAEAQLSKSKSEWACVASATALAISSELTIHACLAGPNPACILGSIAVAISTITTIKSCAHKVDPADVDSALSQLDFAQDQLGAATQELFALSSACPEFPGQTYAAQIDAIQNDLNRLKADAQAIKNELSANRGLLASLKASFESFLKLLQGLDAESMPSPTPLQESIDIQYVVSELEASLARLEALSASYAATSSNAQRALGELETSLSPSGCTYSISGQNVVSSSGLMFTIPNVPVNGALARVESICTSPTGVLFGRSDYVLMVAGQATVATGWEFSETPFPSIEGIDIQPIGQLNEGSVTPLTVTGSFSDGSSPPVNTLADGTTFWTSNGSIASVSTDGMLTAHSPGFVVVFAQNEGALSAAGATVLPQGRRTTVVGVVEFTDGSSAQGASVAIRLAPIVTTGASGSFIVPDISGDIIDVWAQLDSGGVSYGGFVSNVAAVRGGVTNVGVIVIEPASPQNLIASYDSADAVLRTIAPDGSAVGMATLSGPGRAVAIDRFGTAWIAGGDTVRHVSLKGTPQLIASFSYSGAIYAAALAPDDTLWFTSDAPDVVMQVDFAGNVLGTHQFGYKFPGGIAIAPTPSSSAGYMVWFTSYRNVTPGNPARGELVRLDPGDPSTMTPPSQTVIFDTFDLRLFGVAVDDTGKIWVPVDLADTVEDRLDGWWPDGTLYSRNETIGANQSIMQSAVVAPDGRIWCTASNGNSAPYFNPNYLFEFAENGDFFKTHAIKSVSTVPSPGPRGVWVDGDCKVWASLSGVSELFFMNRMTPYQKTLVSVGLGPSNVGDASGYLQAFIQFPNADFDGDGVGNRAELKAGQNPFVFN